jgi:hypothetical protein
MESQGGQRAAPAATTRGDTEPPALRAIEILETCLRQAERENTLRDLAGMDLRSLAALRQRVAEKPRDPDNLKLLRHLAVVWSTRLSGSDYRAFREVFRLIEKCEQPQG